MRIAIFHNYMDNIGGAEIVTLTLARELGADIYSTVADQENIRRMGFDIEVKTISPIPVNAPYRQQIASRTFRKLDLSGEYDLFIISGDWAVSGAIHNKPNLWYVHSPIRELYDMREYVRENIVPKGKYIPNLNKYLFDLWVYYNRYRNRKYVQHVQKLVCNSSNVQARVKKYLDRDAVIVHPPTETERYRYESTGDYWLSVNRLIAPKRVELQLDAFAKLPHERLVIVGTYENAEHFLTYKQKIESTMPGNVTLLSHVPFEKLTKLYANCRGFITTARDEDFGMTAIEAMASGKPVIAPNEGGYKESVVDGVTGTLIDDINGERLAAAIADIRDPAAYREACLARAKAFDTKVFIEKMKHEIGL